MSLPFSLFLGWWTQFWAREKKLPTSRQWAIGRFPQVRGLEGPPTTTTTELSDILNVGKDWLTDFTWRSVQMGKPTRTDSASVVVRTWEVCEKMRHYSQWVQSFTWVWWKCSQIVVTYLHFCEYAQKHWTVCLNWMDCTICKVYPNKTIIFFKMWHFTLCFFLILENITTFGKNVLFIFTCNGLGVVMHNWINKWVFNILPL